MKPISSVRRLAAPRAEVFAAMSDFKNLAGRIKGITRVEMLTDGPVRVGTTFKETRIMFKREATATMVVEVFDAPNAYALGCTECGCKHLSAFRFADAPGGGTDVTMTFEVVPRVCVSSVFSTFASARKVFQAVMPMMTFVGATPDLRNMVSDQVSRSSTGLIPA